MQVPAGYLGDRFGARRVMLSGLLLLNMLTILVAIAPSYLFLGVVLTAIGGLRALAFAPGLALVSSEFPPSRRATSMSLFMASGFSTNLIVSIVAPVFVDDLGWRGIIGIFVFANLVPIVTYWWLSRSQPEVRAEKTGKPRTRTSEFLGEPILWLASIVQFNRLAVTMSLRFWLPTYLVTDKGFSLAQTALVVGVGSALSIAANLLGGQVSDRRQQPVMVISVSLCALTAGLGALTLANDFWLIFLVTGVLYVFVQAYSGSIFEVPLLALGSRNAGTMIGFGNFWANVGGLVMTYVLGVSKDLTASFDAGWLALSGLCVVALITCVFMNRELARRRALTEATESEPA
jgi:nitrate/nitrite transporter NarK